MSAHLKCYPAMRHPGVEWLGDVPQHWDVCRLGQIGEFSRGSGGNKGDEVLSGIPCVRYGDLYTTHEHSIRKSRSFVSPTRVADYTPIKFGDVLFAASGETIAEIGKSAVNLMRTDACCGGDIIIFRPRPPVDAGYMGHAMDCRPVAVQKSTMGRGITVKHIYGHQLKYVTLAFPPLPEQIAIARFLNHADRRIWRYIRAKQKLIVLLEEGKQAVIHQAVTGQIDVRTGQPYLAYKASGVDWLGEVPEHWEVRTFTRSCVEISDYRGATPKKTDSGVFLVTAKNIRRGWINYDASKEFVAEEEYSNIMRRGLPCVGDLLITTEAPLGFAALVDREDIALAQRVIRFRLDQTVLVPGFGLHSVLDSYFQNQLQCRGTGSTALGIKGSKLPQLKIICPPINEQRAVLNHIQTALHNCERELAVAARLIDLLEEYRTRLIADVVTGKLDVRKVAASLPEVDPLGAGHTRCEPEANTAVNPKAPDRALQSAQP